MAYMTELGFSYCENKASYHKKETLLRVIYFFKSVWASLTKENMLKKLLIYCPFSYLQDPAGVTLLLFILNDGVCLRQIPSQHDLKRLSQDGGWADFHQNLRASLFNKYLSTEPNFSQIHPGKQHL